MEALYRSIYEQLADCVRFLAEQGKLKTGSTVVLGCSTSEVAGGVIGHNSVPELGDVLAAAFLDTCRALGLNAAVQCCEHLNRALVMEQATLDALRLTQVNVRPVPKAGGSTGAAAYDRFAHPAMAMSIQADAAIDVGDTLVGMHIRPVAVPLRMPGAMVGQAHVVMAYARYPLIGGARAQYPEAIR
ncbi:MAG TPA: TIGR01440 family protein [Candidatus Limiplasma sp.]|nr:TIGR01440 family protein [Candidatus Limiplasma sp.]HPS80832.1 TIGR01440 family protein [Candidatus Limiplasma sp.]